VYRSFRVSITDCALCPVTQFGACCTDDGCIDESLETPGQPIDPFECEQVLGGTFKDAWEDCFTHRDPTVTAQFACDNCNGGFDCNCALQEHCVNRVCVPCLDQVVEVPETAAPAWHNTGVAVAAGATVTLIAKQCEDLLWGTTIRSQVGEGLTQTGGPDDEYVADQAGALKVRLERQGAPAAGQLCIAITDPPPPPPPPPSPCPPGSNFGVSVQPGGTFCGCCGGSHPFPTADGGCASVEGGPSEVPWLGVDCPNPLP
jgi:hypothetical protein